MPVSAFPPPPEQDDLVLRFFTSPRTRLLRHVVSLLLVVLMVVGTWKPGEVASPYNYVGLGLALTFLFSLLYLNMYVLIPRFFYRRRYTWYLGSLVFSIWVVFCLLLPPQLLLVERHRLTLQQELHPLVGVVALTTLLLPFLLISTAFKLFQRWVADTNRLQNLENSALQNELKALRSQINPHFLFNMLNSIYVLIRRDADLAAQLTLKLSDFLRYLLYEGSQPTVFLSAELKFIADLLALEKMRRDNFEFSLEYSKAAVRGVQVPSYVLITLVENAIKHSQDASNASYVNISVELQAGTLRFACSNTVPAVSARRRSQAAWAWPTSPAAWSCSTPALFP